MRLLQYRKTYSIPESIMNKNNFFKSIKESFEHLYIQSFASEHKILFSTPWFNSKTITDKTGVFNRVHLDGYIEINHREIFFKIGFRRHFMINLSVFVLLFGVNILIYPNLWWLYLSIYCAALFIWIYYVFNKWTKS